jgi:hypothetical protein
MSDIMIISEYVIARKGAAVIGESPYRLPKVVEAAGVRRKVLPGLPVRYHLGDLERLAQESVVGGPAKAEELVGASA